MIRCVAHAECHRARQAERDRRKQLTKAGKLLFLGLLDLLRANGHFWGRCQEPAAVVIVYRADMSPLNAPLGYGPSRDVTGTLILALGTCPREPNDNEKNDDRD